MEIPAIATVMSALGGVVAFLVIRKYVGYRPVSTAPQADALPLQLNPALDSQERFSFAEREADMWRAVEMLSRDGEAMRDEMRQLREMILQVRVEVSENRKAYVESNARERVLERARRQGWKNPPLQEREGAPLESVK
jgi:hypothetical protein